MRCSPPETLKNNWQSLRLIYRAGRIGKCCHEFDIVETAGRWGMSGIAKRKSNCHVNAVTVEYERASNEIEQCY